MVAAALPRVMIASDDAFELTTMSASLRLYGVNVVAEASNKVVAENTFRSLQPDVLIIDLLFGNHFQVIGRGALLRFSVFQGLNDLIKFY